MENIEKLKEKIEKDPSSTLFVPLAEEYRKAGLLDEAISVLRNGIGRQPGYMSARVALGKIYLDKDMKEDAIAEFEKVVDSIPGNLFAQRKLADLYRETGEADKARARYETVLSLNPLDDEASEILQGLKQGEAGQEEPKAAVEAEEAASIEAEEEAVLEAAAEEEVSFGELSESEEQIGEDVGYGEAAEALEVGKEQSGEMESFLEGLSEPFSPVFRVTGEAEAAPVEEIPPLTEADECIRRGDYLKTMEIYNAYLAVDPDNFQVLQRVQELRTLLKLLGRENEILESKLTSFLEAIKARKDEFFGSP